MWYYGVIAGGTTNKVNGACSAVLGGQGNTVTHDYAAVFGHNLSSVANDMFHVSCINAPNTPNIGMIGVPAGTFVWKAGNLLGAADKVLVLHP